MSKYTLSEANDKEDRSIYYGRDIESLETIRRIKGLEFCLIKWFAILIAAPLRCVWRCVHEQLSIMVRGILIAHFDDLK